MRNTLTCALLALSSLTCSTLVHAVSNANGGALNGSGQNGAGDNGAGDNGAGDNGAGDNGSGPNGAKARLALTRGDIVSIKLAKPATR
jgi:hypothetical protein